MYYNSLELSAGTGSVPQSRTEKENNNEKLRLIGLVLGLGIALVVAVWQSGSGQTGRFWSPVDADFVVGGADCYLPVGGKCPGDDKGCDDLPCYKDSGCSAVTHDKKQRNAPVVGTADYYKGTTEAESSEPGWSDVETKEFYCVKRETCELKNGACFVDSMTASLYCSGGNGGNYAELRTEYLLSGNCTGE